MKRPINLSLNLSYYCNFRCKFCYLTDAQLSNKTYLGVDRALEKVDEVLSRYDIGHIDLYGGELLLLPPEDLFRLRDELFVRGIDDLNLNTNLSLLNDVCEDESWDLSVSYDFGVREKHDRVWQNMLMVPRKINILTLASRQLLDTVTPDDYVQQLNLLTNLKSAEIKPYSINQANQERVGFDEFEAFVWAVIEHPERKFYFENRSLVREAARGERNTFSDDHLYITPDGQFAVLEFDQHDREFFLTLSDLDAYDAWCQEEKLRVLTNAFCASCEYQGSCLSEHLREVKSLDHSCNGFKGLIDNWREKYGTA